MISISSLQNIRGVVTREKSGQILKSFYTPEIYRAKDVRKFGINSNFEFDSLRDLNHLEENKEAFQQ